MEEKRVQLEADTQKLNMFQLTLISNIQFMMSNMTAIEQPAKRDMATMSLLMRQTLLTLTKRSIAQLVLQRAEDNKSLREASRMPMI